MSGFEFRHPPLLLSVDVLGVEKCDVDSEITVCKPPHSLRSSVIVAVRKPMNVGLLVVRQKCE